MKNIVFGVLFFFYAMQLFAQDDFRYSSEKYDIEHGLSTNVVTCILQDAEGYIWIGTQDGLNLFDGYSFKFFRHDPTEQNTISSNYILGISESESGDIWIATFYGLNRYNKKTKQFTVWKNIPNIDTSLGSNMVFNVFAQSDSIIWVNCEEYLEKLHVKENKFERFKHKSDYFNNVLSSTSYALEYKNQKLWVGSKDGLHIFDLKLDVFTEIEFDKNSVAGSMVLSVLVEHDKTWVGTANGLYLLSNKGITKSFLYNKLILPENRINAIFRSSNGLLWLGTGSGLFIFDENTESLKRIKNEKNPLKLLDTEVSSITEDSSNILWIGTWDGLFKFDTKKKQFSIISKENTNISNQNIRSILQFNNQLWLGTSTGGLNIISNKTDVKVIKTSNSILKSNFIQTLFVDSKNIVWVGTANGIFLSDNSGNVKPFIPKLNTESLRAFENNRINAILEDYQGNIWIGASKGLFKYANGKLVNYSTNIGTLGAISSAFVYALEKDKNNDIWVGTVDGLNRFSLKTNKFSVFKTEDINDKVNKLSNNSVLALKCDSKGNIWAGTEAGLNKIEIESGNIKYYTNKQGLDNDNIYGILEDKNNNIWVTTNRGIAMLNPTTDIITIFDPADGLQGYEYNLGAVLKGNDQMLYFGGVNGLNAIHPDSLVNFINSRPVKIGLITKMNKNGKLIVLNEHEAKITLQHDDYMLSIEFAMLEYTQSQQNKYMYKMVGIGDEWIDLGTKRNTIFPLLSPGNYVFKVRGSNSNSVWSLDVTELEIEVLPPYYKTNLAYFLYCFFLIVFSFLIYRYITKNLRRVSLALKERERIAFEIANQKEELSVKSVEITDSMNYAQRIIQAMLPSDRRFKQILPDSFILYKPKEIVSGDFFWIAEKNDKVFIAAVDCTGHGVPGAFMSIIGFDLLRDIVINLGIESPSEILNLLSIGVSNTFGSSEELNVTDGMDVAFCVYNRKNFILEFAGAMNPVYIIRDRNILEYKADRFSVGSAMTAAERLFQNHTIELHPDDIFYIFSDGFADQFGGTDGKKFKYRRFRHMLLSIHQLPIEEQRQAIDKVFENWRGTNEQVDDILIIGVKPKKDE